jgi:hypothetical protein
MNVISPTANWSRRLQSSSVYLRNIFLVSAIVFSVTGVLGIGLSLAGLYPPITFFSKCYTLSDALECWFAYKLFSCYRHGDWFASPAVRWLQAIGALSLVRGSGNVANNFLYFVPAHFGRWQHPPLVVAATQTVQFIFSQLLHNVVLGCVILFIAWIMDEGRKLREEQELTV